MTAAITRRSSSRLSSTRCCAAGSTRPRRRRSRHGGCAAWRSGRGRRRGRRSDPPAFLVRPALELLLAGGLAAPELLLPQALPLLLALAPRLIGRGALLARRHLHLVAEGVLADQRATVTPAALVLRLDHLLDVVQLQLDLGLDRPGRLPVEELRGGARRPLADRVEHQEERQQSPNHGELEAHR